MITVVDLKKNALEEIIRSVYEDYNRETFGNLFGYSFEKENRFIYVVEQAHRIASTKPKPTEVSVDIYSGAYKRAQWSSQEFLGAFHSHTLYWNKEGYKKGELNLASKDVDLMRSESFDIFLTIAINESKRTSRTTINPFYFSATLSDYDKKYHIKLGAYYFDKIKRRAVIKVRKKDLREVFG